MKRSLFFGLALGIALFLTGCWIVDLQETFYIQGEVWLDTDADGRIDEGEPPAEGTVVGLYGIEENGDPTLIQEITISDSRGYRFEVSGLYENYFVKFTPPRSSIDRYTLLVDEEAPIENFTTEMLSPDSHVFRVDAATGEGYSRDLHLLNQKVNAGVAINAHLAQEPTPEPKATPTTDPWAWLDANPGLSARITILDDPAGHGPFGAFPGMMDLSLSTNQDYKLDGPAPWIPVDGSIGSDGTITMTGMGTYAGFSDIDATFTGSLTPDGLLSGEYEVGANGGLPQGLSITYGVEGQFEIPAFKGDIGDTPIERVDLFYNDFNDAMARGDGLALWDLTHPAVGEVYGEKLCITYLQGVAQNPISIQPLRIVDEGKWLWEPPGREPVSLNDILTLDIEITLPDGSTTQQETHLGWRDAANLGFFTQCDAQ